MLARPQEFRVDAVESVRLHMSVARRLRCETENLWCARARKCGPIASADRGG